MIDGPYARISVLRPHDGDTVDFEAGYTRHLQWHREAKDTWRWFGWTVWSGERQRCLIYATFGHSAAALDSPVDPAGDERDNVSNVTPHGHFAGHGLYEYLPELSRGTGEPETAPRVEMTTVELGHGAERDFEEALRSAQANIENETLWYRMIAGASVPRYVRLRPRANLSALLGDQTSLPDVPIAKTTIEILTLRPTMSYLP